MILSYLSYLTASDEHRVIQLLELARQDKFLDKILSRLDVLGIDIKFRFWGGPGQYSPQALSVASEDQFHEHFAQTVKQGDMACQFEFSPRHGQAVVVHTWVHELIHAYQDSLGLMMTPLQIDGRMPIILDARSEVQLMLLCESIATVEAIRASWRLKEQGIDAAWRGACLSFDWRKLAKSYEADIRADLSEEEAAINALANWFGMSQRLYYEKRAINMFKKNLKGYQSSAGLADVDILPFLRTMSLQAMLSKLPSFLSSVYQSMPEEISVQTMCEIQALEEKYGTCTNLSVDDIAVGSAPCLSNRQQNKRAA